MALRDHLATFAMRIARAFGHRIGCYLVIEPSEHTVRLSMEVPSKSNRAWDLNHYRWTNIFPDGYANPIRIDVDRHKALETPDEVLPVETRNSTEEAHLAADGGEDVTSHIQLISSHRYREFMRQNLISQLINPSEKLNRLFLAFMVVIGLLIMQIMLIIFSVFG